MLPTHPPTPLNCTPSQLPCWNNDPCLEKRKSVEQRNMSKPSNTPCCTTKQCIYCLHSFSHQACAMMQTNLLWAVSEREHTPQACDSQHLCLLWYRQLCINNNSGHPQSCWHPQRPLRPSPTSPAMKASLALNNFLAWKGVSRSSSAIVSGLKLAKSAPLTPLT